MRRGYGRARGGRQQHWRHASGDTFSSPIATAAAAAAAAAASTRADEDGGGGGGAEPSCSCTIDASFVSGGAQALPASASEKAENIVRAYEGDALRWVWAPNASDARALDPPTGWALSVRGSAPVLKDAFSPRKMFYGTAAIQLPPETRFRDGGALDEARLRANLDQAKTALDQLMSQAQGARAVPRLAMFDAKHGESAAWTEQLAGGGGAYAGLFESTHRGPAGHVTSYWLVAQAGCPQASEDLYRLMEDVGARTTWKAFFFEDSQTQFVRAVAERNRMRLLARVAEALQLDVATEPDLMAFKGPEVRRAPQLIRPHVETLHHNVVQDRAGRVTLYSNAVDPAGARAGILFGENPWLGPVLMRGPDGASDSVGAHAWQLSNAAVVAGAAFPTCTGRPGAAAAAATTAASDGATIDLSRPHPFVWEDRAVNQRLATPGTYRPRDPDFKAAEARLGYNHAWSELDLRPVVVKIATALSDDVLA